MRRRDVSARAFKQMHLKPRLPLPQPPLSLSGWLVAEPLAPLKIIIFHAAMTGGRFFPGSLRPGDKKGAGEGGG